MFAYVESKKSATPSEQSELNARFFRENLIASYCYDKVVMAKESKEKKISMKCLQDSIVLSPSIFPWQ